MENVHFVDSPLNIFNQTNDLIEFAVALLLLLGIVVHNVAWWREILLGIKWERSMNCFKEFGVELKEKREMVRRRRRGERKQLRMGGM